MLKPLIAAAFAALSTAGCVDTLTARRDGLTTAAVPSPSAAPAPASNTSAASWQMQWQISPASAASQGKGEETVLVYVPRTGYVKGTRQAVASIGKPLEAAPGRNRTVEACQNVVRGEATKIGAREVEAVSAGPDRRDASGRYSAPVRMRITYAQPGGFEVREALMTCIVDRQGKIVDAFA